ncbi:hypothetical protein [Paenibacillus ihumii]|uniref:hypothetical protein n=1 Tax=Paenibacillus ihumii TaxID=687436 RepID=UPI0006D861B5|nr:hypothetical protein [Paenibacillus ihumii]
MILSISAVSAEGFNSSVQSQEIVVATPNGVQNAKIEFIDKTKINNGWKISPYGGDRRVYRHSYSQIAKNTITAYNAGPREKDVFLLSVSKGQEKAISSTKKVTGSVQFSTNVGVEIKSLINMAITSNTAGSFSHEWSQSVKYQGPDGNYTTRDYYGAVNYDQYSTIVKTYDVYDEYLGTVKVETSHELVSTQTINGTKAPKAVEYYRDFNN